MQPKAAAWAGRLLRFAVGVAASAAVGTAAAGQGTTGAPSASPDLGAARTVSGRVVRPDANGTVPVPNTWVTLHRVGPDSSGPLDSVRTNASGRYTFRYRPFGMDAVYFASSMFGGIAYFTPPLPPGDVGGGAAEITVFDTTSAPLPIRTRGRHVVVGSSEISGRRTIVEVFELSNDTTVTLVSGQRSRATWSTPVSPNAADFQVGQNDIGSNSVALRDGRVLVFASMSPGIRQVAFSYTVPGSDFPLTVPVADTVDILEVLLEDPRASVTGGGLEEQEAVTLEGRAFRRFLAQNVPPNAPVTIDVGPPPVSGGTRFLLPLLMIAAAMMAIALAFALTRRRQASVASVTPSTTIVPPGDAANLARAIADLDEAFARKASPSDAERDAYRERRAVLKARLTAALAKEEVSV